MTNVVSLRFRTGMPGASSADKPADRAVAHLVKAADAADAAPAVTVSTTAVHCVLGYLRYLESHVVIEPGGPSPSKRLRVRMTAAQSRKLRTNRP